MCIRRRALISPAILPIDFVTVDEGTRQRLIAYLYPIPSSNSAAYGSVVFFLKEQVLPEKIDFVTIRHHIESMLEDSEQLREKMNVQQPLVRDQCLTQLLKGTVKDQQEMGTLRHVGCYRFELFGAIGTT
ncbi:hypothetical protein [Paenibacillus sp. J2TS4]|uniref:hypothetical protein n=1 Tax=Paenibacillus sp. J2TS4 TaxID=2807194 RepID=UPI001B1FB57D|nr:hypothetical protein [Paenibacillus sp. J2TS4]GIP33988.1 hypothetical protein J2TS4_31980 [Paenibacillus sp. J2TS4]